MASGNIAWVMSAASDRGEYQRGITSNPPLGVVAGTQTRDVSDMLDLLALAETPFINRVGWGPESGGLLIEWIAEDLGPKFVQNISAIASDFLSIVLNSSDNSISPSDAIQQLGQGTVLYHFASVGGVHTLNVINSTPATVSITMSTIAATSFGAQTSAPANDKFYILGRVANAGSRPGQGEPRQRKIASNNFVILRQDVQITGSMQATDMYVTGREDKHQILMRLKEMQRDRESNVLYSGKSSRTSAEAATIGGVLYWLLNNATGANVDTSTTALTRTAFENVIDPVWNNGDASQLTAYGDSKQIGKIVDWDLNRIRSRINDRRGGGHITSYLSRMGVEIDLIPMKKVPTNILFLLDDNKIRLRAKKGRKAIMEKLGKAGDMDDWQILSEFSLEMKGYLHGRHGGFLNLT